MGDFPLPMTLIELEKSVGGNITNSTGILKKNIIN